MFNAHIDRRDLGVVAYWLMRHHGPHSILIHPNTGDDLADHTRHALWLGEPLDLNLDNL
jgi:DOPA 4,5-dioxygenase